MSPPSSIAGACLGPGSSSTYLLAMPDSESSKMRATVPWCSGPTPPRSDMPMRASPLRVRLMELIVPTAAGPMRTLSPVTSPLAFWKSAFSE